MNQLLESLSLHLNCIHNPTEVLRNLTETYALTWFQSNKYRNIPMDSMEIGKCEFESIDLIDLELRFWISRSAGFGILDWCAFSTKNMMFKIITSLDFNYVKPCLDLVQL